MVPLDVSISIGDGPSLIVAVVSRSPVAAPATGARLDGEGAGLVGLAERVSLADGELEHGRDENGDFVLRATLPWAP
jgi:hypothetical protein